MSNEITEKDKKDFSEHVKRGNWSDAKMILYRLAGNKRPTEVVPFDVAKGDFLKSIKIGLLENCVKLLRQHPDLVTKSSEEIEKIMEKNKKNNKLNFTENHFPGEQTHEASKSWDEPDDFELVEASEEEKPELGKPLGQINLELLSKELDDLNVAQVSNGIKK
jgi:hypothetical protein